MKNEVFWDVRSNESTVNSYRRFGRVEYLHVLGQAIQEETRRSIPRRLHRSPFLLGINLLKRNLN